MTDAKPILPGATIGVLGSGQLGRMLALAARRMGYRVATLSPDRDSPTGQVADREVVAAYDDLDAVADFARGVDVVTFEFENVASVSAEAAAMHAPVRPDGMVLHTTQNRLREKHALLAGGFPLTPFAAINGPDDFAEAAINAGLPGVLKTAGFGYDGKGQRPVKGATELAAAFEDLGGVECVLEAFVDFRCEVSVVAARGVDGTVVDWGVMENDHANHILDVSLSPARVSPSVATEARRIAHGILEHLGVVGVMCVEMFVTGDDRVLVNELAPRPHNSGHLTIEASPTSQFEQQLRAACALPLGATGPMRPAAMVNLLGDVWADGEPDWARALAVPGAALHLYGKAEARPGRKMGHVTALGDDVEAARATALAARAALAGG